MEFFQIIPLGFRNAVQTKLEMKIIAQLIPKNAKIPFRPAQEMDPPKWCDCLVKPKEKGEKKVTWWGPFSAVWDRPI